MKKILFKPLTFLITFVAIALIVFILDICLAIFNSDLTLWFTLIELFLTLTMTVYAFAFCIKLISQPRRETYKVLVMSLIAVGFMVLLTFLNYYIWIYL